MLGFTLRKIFLFLLILLYTPLAYSKDILISFDGSGDLPVWRRTLDFAKKNKVKYTYFVSAPYFMMRSDLKEHPYWALKEIGQPPIKFRDGELQEGHIKLRFNYLIRAIKEGHEIASHLCGHYDGSRWTYDQWIKEMEFFKLAMFLHFPPDIEGISGIVGIRAPNLAINNSYFLAAKHEGFLYDSSLVGQDTNNNLIKEIPIRRVKVGNVQPTLENGWFVIRPKYIIPFDYEFNVAKKFLIGHNGAEQFFESICLDYLNNASPTQICLHFENFGDDSPYLQAMENFVLWAKDKNPNYMTYKEYMEKSY